MIAGLEDPTAGNVFIGDVRVNDVEPKQRDVAMVFQSYALYPHKTVQANIEFPLKVRGVGKDERAAQAVAAAEGLGLGDQLQRRPGQLSGGQRQRVALARAIVRHPAVFCMDEPLSNLDAKLRSETRAELVALHRRLSSTFIYVTHDQVEAMTMGDARGGDAPRPHRAGRHPGRGVRRAGLGVRRPVHRYAADERAAGGHGRARRPVGGRATRAPVDRPGRAAAQRASNWSSSSATRRWCTRTSARPGWWCG